MRRVDTKLIEFCLFNYQAINEAIEDALCDVTSEKVGNFYSVSNPIEAQAFKDLIPISSLYVEDKWNGKLELVPFPQKMISVIDEIYEHFRGTTHGQVLQLRYQEHRKKEEMCDYLNLNTRAYYKILDEVLNFGVALATVYLK